MVTDRMAGVELTQLEPHAPKPRRDHLLFFDFDGTLIDVADGPDAIVLSKTLAPLLVAAGRSLGAARRLPISFSSPSSR